jgi:hypothetical protein
MEQRLKHGIKTVRTKKYMTLITSDNVDDYTDEIELVNATNTMTTNDMVDAYLFAWVIVNLHLQGYTQIASIYANEVHNVSFRKFYDNLFALLLSNDVFSVVLKDVKRQINDLLTTGELPDGISAHNLVFIDSELAYLNKHIIFDALSTLYNELNIVNDSVLKLQQLFIYDQDTKYPVEHEANFNTKTFVNEETKYKINSTMTTWSTTKEFKNLYYALRRKGAIKNKLTVNYN